MQFCIIYNSFTFWYVNYIDSKEFFTTSPINVSWDSKYNMNGEYVFLIFLRGRYFWLDKIFG